MDELGVGTPELVRAVGHAVPLSSGSSSCLPGTCSDVARATPSPVPLARQSIAFRRLTVLFGSCEAGEERLDGQPTLVVERPGGDFLVTSTVMHAGVLQELVHHLSELRLLTPRRATIVVPLKEGSVEQARQLPLRGLRSTRWTRCWCATSSCSRRARRSSCSRRTPSWHSRHCSVTLTSTLETQLHGTRGRSVNGNGPSPHAQTPTPTSSG